MIKKFSWFCANVAMGYLMLHLGLFVAGNFL